MKKSLLDPSQARSLDKTMAGKMDQTGQLLLELGNELERMLFLFFMIYCKETLYITTKCLKISPKQFNTIITNDVL